jgi:micrococcal nuclease
MVNAELVRQGYAQVATYPPNVRYADHFRQLQQDAHQAEIGCWKPP